MTSGQLLSASLMPVHLSALHLQSCDGCGSEFSHDSLHRWFKAVTWQAVSMALWTRAATMPGQSLGFWTCSASSFQTVSKRCDWTAGSRTSPPSWPSRAIDSSVEMASRLSEWLITITFTRFIQGLVSRQLQLSPRQLHKIPVQHHWAAVNLLGTEKSRFFVLLLRIPPKRQKAELITQTLNTIKDDAKKRQSVWLLNKKEVAHSFSCS